MTGARPKLRVGPVYHRRGARALEGVVAAGTRHVRARVKDPARRPRTRREAKPRPVSFFLFFLAARDLVSASGIKRTRGELRTVRSVDFFHFSSQNPRGGRESCEYFMHAEIVLFLVKPRCGVSVPFLSVRYHLILPSVPFLDIMMGKKRNVPVLPNHFSGRACGCV